LAIAKTLDILLRAPTSKLDADFKKAQNLAKNFTGTLKGLVAGAIGGFTLAGFFSKINEGFRTLDESAKRALKINVDVSEVRGLELAAQLSGVAVDKLTSSYSILNKQIDAANQGGKTQQELFKSLGLDSNALSGLGAGQQFEVIAKSLDQIQDRTRRAALAVQLFGRGGLDLLPMLANGGKGLADAMKDAQRLGGFISNEEAASVEAANDAFTRLSFTVKSFYQRVAVDFAPAMQRLFTVIANGIAPGTFLNGVFKVFADTLGFAVRLVSLLAAGVMATSQVFGNFAGRVFGAIILAAALIRAYTALTAMLTLLRIRTMALAAVEAARVALQKKNLAMSLAVAGLGIAAFAAFSDQINAMVDGLLGAVDAQDDLNKGLGDFDKLQEGISRKNKINLGSAQFGTQAALEQILTVRSDRQGMGEIKGVIEDGNEILGQIRDGLQGVGGIMGGDFGEANL
jgi:hypothetical protein